MNITIIDASAGLGVETVKKALQGNHKVTTLSRSEILLPHDLDLTTGIVTNKTDPKRSIENADAVIVALGIGKSVKPTMLYSDLVKLLEEKEIQQRTNTQVPFIAVTGFEAEESGTYSTFLMKIFFKSYAKMCVPAKLK